MSSPVDGLCRSDQAWHAAWAGGLRFRPLKAGQGRGCEGAKTSEVVQPVQEGHSFLPARGARILSVAGHLSRWRRGTASVQFLLQLLGFPEAALRLGGACCTVHAPTKWSNGNVTGTFFCAMLLHKRSTMSPSPLALLYDPKEIDAAPHPMRPGGGGGESQPLPTETALPMTSVWQSPPHACVLPSFTDTFLSPVLLPPRTLASASLSALPSL